MKRFTSISNAGTGARGAGLLMWLGSAAVSWSVVTLVEAISATQTYPLFAFALISGMPLLLIAAIVGIFIFRTGRRLAVDGTVHRRAQLIFATSAAFFLWMGWNWQRWWSMEENQSLTVVGAGPGYEASIDRQQFVRLIVGLICATGVVLVRRRRSAATTAPLRARTQRSVLAGVITILVIAGVGTAGERWADQKQASLVAEVASKVKWTYTADRPLLPAAIGDTQIWASDEDGTVYVIDPRTGRGQPIARVPGASSKWEVTRAGASLYVATHSSIVSLDRSGNERWAYHVQEVETGPTSIDGRPAVGAGVVVAPTHSSRLLTALDQDTGRLRWQTAASDDDPFFDDLFFSPSFGETTATARAIVVGTDDGFLHALNPSTGTVQWRTKLQGWARSAPLVHRGSIYAATDHGHLYRVDEHSGTVRWAALDVAGSSPPQVALSGHQILLITVDEARRLGELRAFDADTGRRTWTFHLADEGIVAMASAGKTIIAVSHVGNLYELERRSGASVSCIGLPYRLTSVKSISVHDGSAIVTGANSIIAIPPWRFTDDFLRQYQTRTLLREDCPRIRATEG